MTGCIQTAVESTDKIAFELKRIPEISEQDSSNNSKMVS